MCIRDSKRADRHGARLPERTPLCARCELGSGTLTAVSTSSAAGRTAPSPALHPAPVLAHVVRNGTVESVHHGTAVVTAADGSISRAWGDPVGLVFPRSANKPLQALAMVELGLDLPAHQLALACASHSGEQVHLDTALEILHGAGLGEGDLGNTPDYPYDEATKIAWLHDRKPMTALAQNCSGKHAAMVVTSAARGWSLPAVSYTHLDVYKRQRLLLYRYPSYIIM